MMTPDWGIMMALNAKKWGIYVALGKLEREVGLTQNPGLFSQQYYFNKIIRFV